MTTKDYAIVPRILDVFLSFTWLNGRYCDKTYSRKDVVEFFGIDGIRRAMDIDGSK